MDLSNVLPRLSRRPWQMAITVHLPPRSTLFHVYWPRLTPGYTARSMSTSPRVATSHFARAHKGCSVSVGTHASLWQPQVGKYATLSQGHRGLHRHKRTFISGASHASSRGTRKERSTQHYLACVCVSLYMRIRGCKMYIYIYVRLFVFARESVFVLQVNSHLSTRELFQVVACTNVRDAFLTPFIQRSLPRDEKWFWFSMKLRDPESRLNFYILGDVYRNQWRERTHCVNVSVDVYTINIVKEKFHY